MRKDVERGANTDSVPMRTQEQEEVRNLSSAQLLRFLTTRRWFGAKGREPECAHVVDTVPVGDAGWIARVDVALREGVERYLLTLRSQELGVRGEGDAVLEGLEDERFRRVLGEAITRGAALEGAGVRWVVEWTAPPPDELPAPRLAGVEQSNTSLIFGDVAIMKLYRRLERGEHPDAEIARFLTTRAHFPHTPQLLATARLESSGGVEVAAMLQQFLSGSRNARTVALERAREAFRLHGAKGIPFAAEAETLGDVTRAMHIALASDDRDPAFAPEPATSADVAQWARATRDASDRVLALLERSLTSGVLSPAARSDAQEVIGRRDVMRTLVDGWLAEIGSDLGARIRHHGDYHLEQVLQAADGAFMVIDFEGEPARPLQERRAKHSALRDVAGMMRSFWYVAATCADAARAELGDGDAVTRSERWEHEMRDAFLRGYLPEGRAHPQFLPQARARLDVLLELFEAEKLFYELGYELNNRPSWVWIPLRGLVTLLRGAS
jgi:trehalose synthase-fused probable maltokinase